MSETTDPTLKSWIDSANRPDSDFPIQNLPYGIFSRNHGPRDLLRVGVAIGDLVLDLAEAWPELAPDKPDLAGELFDQPTLNAFLAAGEKTWTLVRHRLSRWLRDSSPELRDNAVLRDRCLIPISDVTLHLPVEIGDYTDFYSSLHHATNVGSMFRPDNPLLPNWKHIPVGYHGRASSIVVSGTPVRRPWGQTKADDAPAPSFSPSRLLDFELEIGFLTGPGNELGQPIPVAEAHRHIFGLVLVNDWSARDIQKWEYVPLGPFLAKNFATTISPWVVPLEALTPFRVETPRGSDDPPVQPYLDGDRDAVWKWNLDLPLEVALRSSAMRESGAPPQIIARTNYRHMYWNMVQQLAHQTVNGCNIRPGDLYASGTVSGPEKESRGCLLELTWRGEQPITLTATGETRKFLADGDELIITGACGGNGRPRIGFGQCAGIVLPAHEANPPRRA